MIPFRAEAQCEAEELETKAVAAAADVLAGAVLKRRMVQDRKMLQRVSEYREDDLGDDVVRQMARRVLLM